MKRKRLAHDWVAIATFQLTPEMAAAAHVEGAAKGTLSVDNLRSLFVACFACELLWQDAQGTACGGQPVVQIGPGGIPVRPAGN